MSGLGVRKRLIMAYKITGSVAYEWRRAEEPCISVASSLSLKASAPEKRERSKRSRAVLYCHGKWRESGSLGAVSKQPYEVLCVSKHPVSWRIVKDHVAIRYIDPLCPLAAPYVVSVMVFAE